MDSDADDRVRIVAGNCGDDDLDLYVELDRNILQSASNLYNTTVGMDGGKDALRILIACDSQIVLDMVKQVIEILDEQSVQPAIESWSANILKTRSANADELVQMIKILELLDLRGWRHDVLSQIITALHDECIHITYTVNHDNDNVITMTPMTLETFMNHAVSFRAHNKERIFALDVHKGKRTRAADYERDDKLMVVRGGPGRLFRAIFELVLAKAEQYGKYGNSTDALVINLASFVAKFRTELLVTNNDFDRLWDAFNGNAHVQRHMARLFAMNKPSPKRNTLTSSVPASDVPHYKWVDMTVSSRPGCTIHLVLHHVAPAVVDLS